MSEETVVSTEAKSGKGVTKFSLDEFMVHYVEAQVAKESLEGLVNRLAKAKDLPMKTEKQRESLLNYASNKMQALRTTVKEEYGQVLAPLERRSRTVGGTSVSNEQKKANITGLLGKLAELGKVKPVETEEKTEDTQNEEAQVPNMAETPEVNSESSE